MEPKSDPPASDDLSLDYHNLDEEEKMVLLSRLIDQDELQPLDQSKLSEATINILQVFDVVKHLRQEISTRLFKQYVISMTHMASHVMEVMFLCKLSGLLGKDADGNPYCYMTVSPLFETVEDLEHIEPMMSVLFNNAVYTQYLSAAGNLQEVMLGYSDSCKDGGILASSWNLYGAQRRITELAKNSEHHYRTLTDKTPGFLDYFYEATPVSEIGLMNIGSRPSHRKSGDRSKSSVRAIGWVFGWAQSRHTLPAWYGIDTALNEYIEQNNTNLEQLKKMYKEWPYFNTLLDNTQMALFKADMDIAKEYALLCKDKQIRDSVYELINKEYNLTVQSILKIAGIDELLAQNSILKLSLGRRQAYLDTLVHIQLTLLKRYRNDALTKEEQSVWLSPLLCSINAIAGGMRNTG